MTPERLTPEREKELAAFLLGTALGEEILDELYNLRAERDALAEKAADLVVSLGELALTYPAKQRESEQWAEVGLLSHELDNLLHEPAIAQRLEDAEELRAAIEPFVQGHEQMQRDPQDTPDTRVLYHKGITLGVIARLAAARDRMWGSKPVTPRDPDAEQLLRDAIDDLPDPSQGTGPFSPTALQVIRVKDARKKLWPDGRS